MIFQYKIYLKNILIIFSLFFLAVLPGCQKGQQSGGVISGPSELVIETTGTQSVYVINDLPNLVVNISAKNLPAGVTSTSCTAKSFSGCSFNLISNNAAPGNSTISIAGADSNVLSAHLIVSGTPILKADIVASSNIIQLKTPDTTSITLTNMSKVAAENITVTGLPSSVQASGCNTIDALKSCQLVFTSSTSEASGSWQIGIQGTNTNLLLPTLTLSLLNISVPSPINLVAGEATTVQVSNLDTGIQALDIKVSGPAGVTAGTCTASASGTCDLSLQANNSVAAGSTLITFQGLNTVPVQSNLVVSVPPPLPPSMAEISVSPTTLNLNSTDTGSVTVTNESGVAATNINVTPNPILNGSVTVDASGCANLPPAPSSLFKKARLWLSNTLPPNACTITFTSTGASAGNVSLNIAGTNTNTVALSLTITAGSQTNITVPPSLPILSTGAGQITVKNVGEIPVEGVTVSGLPGSISVTTNTCSTVPAYGSCSITLNSTNATPTTAPLPLSIQGLNTKPAVTNLSVTANNSIPPTKPGFMPVGFMNQSMIANAQDIYISVKGFEPTANAQSCYVSFDSNGIGTCVAVDPTQRYKDLGTPLSAFPEINGIYYLYLPSIQSGRIYISMGQGMEFNIAAQINPVTNIQESLLQDPDGYNQRDPSYNVLYDKVEFTYMNGQAYFNPTAVDFFAIPLHLLMTGTGTYSGLTEKRSDILSTAWSAFTASNVSDEWRKLFFTYNYRDINTVLRVSSPDKAITTGAPQFYEQPFDEAYLTDLDGGVKQNKFTNSNNESYADAVWEYYKNNTLQVTDPDQINGKPMPVFTGQVDSNNNFVFTDGNSADTFRLPKPTLSGAFFGGTGQDQGAPANNTYGAIITRNLTSAFDAGLLPGDHLILDKRTFSELNEAGKFYQDNANWYTPKQAPWYDLYSKVFHSFPDQNIYTFAYDDELGQDGTLVEPAPGQSSTMYPLLITIGDMSGSAIPPSPDSDPTRYNVILNIPDGANVLDQYGHPLANGLLANQASPLIVQIFGNTEKIYFSPPLILPELDGIGIAKATDSDNMVVTFPAQNNLGLAPGWTSAIGCGIDLPNISPNEGASALFKLDSAETSCNVALLSPAITVQLKINYNNGLKIINPIACTNTTTQKNCLTAIQADVNNNVGIPPPSAM